MGSRGRDRFRREYTPRPEEKGHTGRSHPPSRHLWVGNLSQSLTESNLARHFLQFGDLERVSFQPSRSYAFISYRNEEDAFAAIRKLQGSLVAGKELKIEFTKAEKSSLQQRSEDSVPQREQHRSSARRSSFPQRDSGVRHSSPDPPCMDKSKSTEKNAEPSEVLWVGFPAQLKVDEFVLRRAFSPFGEIEKITAFPGRTYAFIRFRNLISACKARETLHGKLFGNPRVHICFARNESGTSNRERPDYRSPEHVGSSENFHHERHYDDIAGDPPGIRSPRFLAKLDTNDPHLRGVSRKEKLWTGGNRGFDNGRFLEGGTGLGLPEKMYEQSRSPLEDRGLSRGPPLRDKGAHFRDFSPPRIPLEGPFYDDPWDLPEDVSVFHEAKKLKTGTFPPENELPEYPLSSMGSSKQLPSRYPEFHQPESYNQEFEPATLGYKPVDDRIKNSTHPYGDRNDHLNVPYYGSRVIPGSFPSETDWKRFISEPKQSSRKKEWKWEGTIAKGGTPVCRARCFPVGKLMDTMLPEFVDCTARTSLDMLAKHYYQAVSAWVVFFVPANDHDIALYNEFMNYLEEKQRAAVAKLDDKTTLFLVPPSEFSEKVLKVPGRLSISGVVLSLEQPGSGYGPLHHQSESRGTDLSSFHGKPASPPPGPYSSMPFIPNVEKSEMMSTTFPEGFSRGPVSHPGSSHSADNISRDRHEYLLPQLNPAGQNWSPHDIQNANNMAADNSYAMPRSVQENSMHTSDIQGRLSVPEKPHAPVSAPGAALQTEQLVQLASSLFGQAQQLGAVPSAEDFRRSDNSYRPSQNYPAPQYSQLQQQQQQQMPVHPNEHHPGMQMNQQPLNAGEGEGPETRLQATLQLAAALLQQIQGKGT